MEIPIFVNLPDQEQVSPMGQALINAVATENIRQRPGETSLTSVTGHIDGIYDWSEHDIVVICAAGQIYKASRAAILGAYGLLVDGSAEQLLVDGSTDDLLLDSSTVIENVTSDELLSYKNVTFGNYGDILFIANGLQPLELFHEISVVVNSGTIYTCTQNNIDIEPGVTSGWEDYWTATGSGSDTWYAGVRYGSGLTEAVTTAPDYVSFVGVANKYLLALEKNTERMFFSVVTTPWEFDADWVSAEFLPDNASCLKVVDGDVWVFGARSMQQFTASSVGWSPSTYPAITDGTIAPHSVVDISGTLVWLSSDRRIVMLDGRSAIQINSTLDNFIATLETVNDAEAYISVIGGLSFYIIYFPTENKTIALNVGTKGWSEWTEFDGVIADIPSWGISLVGQANGDIEKISFEAVPTAAGTLRTPRLQTSAGVFVGELLIGLTKIAGKTASGESTFTVKYRDDGGGWSTARTITVDQDETDHVCFLRRLGSYRRNRQYEFNISGLWPFAIQRVDQT